ncbi:putative Homeobox protein 32 [Hibiscus syriacus]|uniref:Homeobox protein 32 n=1 Tax=Hibiscus syriacus TaxID=106335 RepID=A0A6A3CMZ3_HIBSY|nr:putative Homeobox protein 32 [Hibiscus syriacus]
MKLRKKAVGAIKDKSSIVVVYISTRNSFRNPDPEAAIVKATSHDEYHIDKRNSQVVFSWIRMSPVSLRPITWALSSRMEKTQSWVVAIKGLMLMHGVFHCKVPVVEMMPRLPFDLSSFSDGHLKPNKSWGFNSIIREYFAFLDQKASILFNQDNNNRKSEDPENMKVRLILKAMDCVVVEIFVVYGIICCDIAKVLLKIYSISRQEATLAVKVLQKATKQGEELSLFFEFCKEYGVSNASQFSTVTQIPEEKFEELERIKSMGSRFQTRH